MNYHNISHNDIWNGEGTRTVLFVSGCAHNCPGCQNPQTHDLKSGILFDTDALFELLESLEDKYIDGVTFSGGDPLHEANINTIVKICKLIRKLYPDKTIWIYTGYTMTQIQVLAKFQSSYKELLKAHLADVIVDGPFVEKLADRDYPYAGSVNQKLWKYNSAEDRYDPYLIH